MFFNYIPDVENNTKKEYQINELILIHIDTAES